MSRKHKFYNKKGLYFVSFATIFLTLGITLFTILKPSGQYLKDGYYYLPRYEALDVGYPGGGIVYKSAQKDSFYEIKITGNVSEAKANKGFIIASQNTDTSYIESKPSDFSSPELLRYYIVVKKS